MWLETKSCSERAQEAQNGLILILNVLFFVEVCNASCGYAGNNILLINYLCKFIQAARETGALKEAKDKLEKRVEELTWRLQLEKRLRVMFIVFCIMLE